MNKNLPDFVPLGSYTRARRGRALLAGRGIFCGISRRTGRQGCVYGLQCPPGSQAAEMLREEGLLPARKGGEGP